MARTLRIDKSVGLITIELNKTELKRILDSIDLMVQECKRNLLERVPSNEYDRNQLEVYNDLRELIFKAWRSID
jgi:hypothetical protein